MEIKFFVPGEPQALKRHRTFQRPGMKFPIQYDPSAIDKKDFLAKAMASRPQSPLAGCLMLTCCFYFGRPKSHYGTGRNAAMLKSVYHDRQFKDNKPDLDNLTKFVLDALNGIFWRDDAQVVAMAAQKQYCETNCPHGAGAEITIKELI